MRISDWSSDVCSSDLDGLSAVYSFFEPGAEKRALGRFMILDLVRQAVAERLPYVYLGYWVRGSRKMSYKTRYRQVECLGPNGWPELVADEQPATQGETTPTPSRKQTNPPETLSRRQEERR